MSSIHTSAQAKKIFACLGTNIGEQLKDNSSNWKKAKGIIILMDQKSNTCSLLIKRHYQISVTMAIELINCNFYINLSEANGNTSFIFKYTRIQIQVCFCIVSKTSTCMFCAQDLSLLKESNYQIKCDYCNSNYRI